MAPANKAKMPWSVKGVSVDSRELAKTAAADHDSTMGEWLSHVIRRVGAAEASGQSLPVPATDGSGSPLRTGAIAADGEMLEDAALVAGVHTRLERSEARLLDVLDGLEDVVEKLSDRIARLERRLDESER